MSHKNCVRCGICKEENRDINTAEKLKSVLFVIIVPLFAFLLGVAATLSAIKNNEMKYLYSFFVGAGLLFISYKVIAFCAKEKKNG